MQGIMPEVVAQLVEICYKNLENHIVGSNGVSIGPRSILDNFTPALAPLQAICRGDKRMARAGVKLSRMDLGCVLIVVIMVY